MFKKCTPLNFSKFYLVFVFEGWKKSDEDDRVAKLLRKYFGARAHRNYAVAVALFYHFAPNKYFD